MAEEVFRPERKKITSEAIEQVSEPLAGPEAMRQAVDKDAGQDFEPRSSMEGGIQIKGTPPKAWFDAMNQNKSGKQKSDSVQIPKGVSSELSALLEGLVKGGSLFEPITLPSCGRFYNGDDGPTNGVINIRPMTGEEEQILATPRFVRKGQAINMIFQRCMQESYRTEEFLTVDRTYLLIWLRGISYTPEYDVEIKCQECDRKFSTVIDLNSLFVESCPDDFGPDLRDILPKSGYRFQYRLSRGKDEIEIQDYRDRRIKMFGDSSTDDTLTYRTAMLLDNIEGITDKKELQTLVKNLPIQDVSYIRGLVNEPPFGVNTTIEMSCPSCIKEFEVDLPLEANFFFPRRKKRDKTQV